MGRCNLAQHLAAGAHPLAHLVRVRVKVRVRVGVSVRIGVRVRADAKTLRR